MSRGRRGLMVMPLDCGTGGCEFKPRRCQNIFDLMERLRATNLALRLVLHDVRGGWRWRRLDQDLRGCTYEKGSKNRFELETRLNGQRQKLQ